MAWFRISFLGLALGDFPNLLISVIKFLSFNDL